MNKINLLALLIVVGIANASPEYKIDTTSISPASPVVSLDFDSDVPVHLTELSVTFGNLPAGLTYTVTSAGGMYQCTSSSSMPNELTVISTGANLASALPVPTQGVCNTRV